MADNKLRPKWTSFELKKLRLFGKPWSEANRREAPALSLHVVNGNPRFRLYYNNGKTNNAFPIAFDPHIFFQLLEALKYIASKPSADKITMEIKATYDKGMKLDKPMVVSKVIVGRDTDGTVYIAIAIKGEQQAIFPFQPSFYASLVGADGEILSPALASTFAAQGYAELMSKMVASHLVVHTTDPDAGKAPREDKPSSSWKGASEASFDDDIAF